MPRHPLTIAVISNTRFVREAIVEYLNGCALGPVLSLSATTIAGGPPELGGMDVGLAIVDVHHVQSRECVQWAAEVVRVVRRSWPGVTIVALGSRLELTAQAAGADVRLHAPSASIRELVRLATAVRDGEAPADAGRGGREPDVASWRTLSRREHQVLALVAGGHDNATIARVLNITPRTVKAHVSSLLKKLAVENRTELAIVGRDAGFGDSRAELVDPASPG